jgi:hypothetical protein
MNEGPNLGAKAGRVEPGDLVICGGEYTPVLRIVIHPRGHDVPAIRSDMVCVECRTARGVRVLGADAAWIDGGLGVTWERA